MVKTILLMPLPVTSPPAQVDHVQRHALVFQLFERAERIVCRTEHSIQLRRDDNVALADGFEQTPAFRAIRERHRSVDARRLANKGHRQRRGSLRLLKDN